MDFYSIIVVLIFSPCILAAPSLSRGSNLEQGSPTTASSGSGVEVGDDGTSTAVAEADTAAVTDEDANAQNIATSNASNYVLDLGPVDVTDTDSKASASSQIDGGPDGPFAESQATAEYSKLGVDVGDVGVSASKATTTSESQVSDGGVTSESQASSEVSSLDVKVGDVDLSLSETNSNAEAKVTSSGEETVLANSHAASGGTTIGFGGGSSSSYAGSATDAEVGSYRPGFGTEGRSHGGRGGLIGDGRGGFVNGIREGTLGIGRTTSETIHINHPVGEVFPPLHSNVVRYLDPCLRQGRVLG